MNDNIEKNNQDNKENPVADSDATEAFKWEYYESQEDCDKEESEPSESNETTVADEPITEEDPKTEEEQTNENSLPPEPEQKTKAELRRERREKRFKKRYSTKALVKESILAKLLSAVSILLLVTLTALLMLGVIPTDNRVVFVQVSNLGPVGTAPGDASSELIEEFKNSVVVITVKTKTGGATGSGIIMTEDGYIATNYHVVDDATEINITLYNSDEKIPARLMGYSERDDIAVLKANLEDARPATFARSEDCRVGERVYSVGAPEGEEFGWTVTQGIISSPLREIKIYDEEYILEKKMYLLQTDAAVNPGNSGGPLINARGEVVGIITLKRSDSAGIGFALPSSASLELIEAIIEKGSIEGIDSQI